MESVREGYAVVTMPSDWLVENKSPDAILNVLNIIIKQYK
jgi:hypothetical protein